MDSCWISLTSASQASMQSLQSKWHKHAHPACTSNSSSNTPGQDGTSHRGECEARVEVICRTLWLPRSCARSKMLGQTALRLASSCAHEAMCIDARLACKQVLQAATEDFTENHGSTMLAWTLLLPFPRQRIQQRPARSIARCQATPGDRDSKWPWEPARPRATPAHA